MITFDSYSRYAASYVDKDGGSVPTSARKDRTVTKFTVYTAKEGDSFDLLANVYLGSSARYWEIADINPHIPFPDTIEPGSYVRIPSR